MKIQKHIHREKAVALIIVLAMLVLLSGIIVSFMTTVGNERAASVISNNAVTSRQIADSTVNLVISQIRDATSQSADSSNATTWASQPGAIRTFSGTTGGLKNIANGATGVKQPVYQPGSNDFIFKLYSAEKMRIPAAELGATAWEKKEVEAIEGWDRTLSDTAREDTKSMFGYVDLNEPILTPMPASLTGGDVKVVEPRYPIIDPRAKYSVAEAPPSPVADPGIVDGFDMKTGIVDANLKFLSKDRLGVRGAPQKVPYLPMPVKWLYVMRDGTMAAAEDGGGGTIPGATAENPIIGRTAFWTDDDSCRLNINTASEGTFWDTPVISAETESGNVDGAKALTSSASSLALGAAQPVRGEYQRYPGHPATTCLSPALGWMWNILPKDAPRAQRDVNLVLMKDGISQLAPFSPYSYKGPKSSQLPAPVVPISPQSTSMGGAYNADKDLDGSKEPLLAIATKRLYTTVDEMVFKQDRVTTNPKDPTTLSNDNIKPESLEKVRFFLTANSRSPELNLFGRPRVTFWPINANEAQRTAFDDLFAFTSTFYKNPDGIRSKDNTFYLTRFDAKSRTKDFTLPKLDGLTLSKNEQIFKYLKLMTGDGAFKKIPGFGGNFATKYSAVGQYSERDQILTEIFDYCRTVNLVDTSSRLRGGDFFTYTPVFGGTQSGKYGGSAIRSNDWSGQVTPLRTDEPDTENAGYQGLGRFPTISEAAIVFHRSGATPANQLQATLLFEMATVMPGYPIIRETFWTRVTVERPTTVEIGGTAVDIELVGRQGDARINIVNVPSHDATNGRGFMPILGFLNQMCYYVEPQGQPSDISDKNAPIPPPGSPIRKTFSKHGSTLDGGYLRRTTNTYYPYVSNTFAPSGAGLTFYGGAYKVEIFAGEAPDDKRNDRKNERVPVPVQTIHLDFPSQKVTASPLPTGGDAGFDKRTSWSAALDDGWNLLNGQDIIRSIEFVGPSQTSTGAPLGLNHQGDLRLLQATRNVPTSWYKERMPGAATVSDSYFSTAPQVHGLSVGHGEPYTGSKPSSPGSYGVFATGGSNREQTGGGPKRAILPAGVKGVQNSAGGAGDYDRGLSKHMDAAAGNKVDEGNIGFEYGLNSVGNSVPYFRGRSIEETGQTFFSPNRQISSAVMFGSLPTGVVHGQPWQTLLFRPDRGKQPHPGGWSSGHPADHLFLDLFNLPIVEPYAISEAFSSAGKVNINYVIAPFGYARGDQGSKYKTNKMDRSYLRRDTAVRGVLKAVKVMAVPTGQPEGGHNEQPVNVQGTYRFDIDAEKTLDQFEDRLKDPTRGLFRSASEICDMDLYPVSVPSASITVSDWATFWDTNYAQTGDNMRERPYSHIYPRITTKSNVYTVYMRCQAVKKVAGTPVNKFDPKRDKVIGSYRGSATIERFVDPNDPELANYDPSLPDASVDQYYRFRVLGTKQFLPR